jgi:hypothetical protein
VRNSQDNDVATFDDLKQRVRKADESFAANITREFCPFWKLLEEFDSGLEFRDELL